jgi:hypothetical protein
VIPRVKVTNVLKLKPRYKTDKLSILVKLVQEIKYKLCLVPQILSMYVHFNFSCSINKILIKRKSVTTKTGIPNWRIVYCHVLINSCLSVRSQKRRKLEKVKRLWSPQFWTVKGYIFLTLGGSWKDSQTKPLVVKRRRIQKDLMVETLVTIVCLLNVLK